MALYRPRMSKLAAIAAAADPRAALVGHLEALCETDDCRALVRWLGEFIDTVALLDDGRLEAQLAAAEHQLRIAPPADPSTVDPAELASLRAVWAHAARLEVSRIGGVDPIELLGPGQEGSWVEDDDNLFSGCKIDDDLTAIVDQLAEEPWIRGAGTSPIQQVQSANIGPWFVLDHRAPTVRGEPGLRRVVRTAPKSALHYEVQPPVAGAFGLGAAWLRIVAAEVLGVPDAVAFGPYAELRACVAAGPRWFLIDRAGDRAALLHLTRGVRGQQVHVALRPFGQRATTRFLKPEPGLDLVEQGRREAASLVAQGFTDLATR
jgi:hypothetical protein